MYCPDRGELISDDDDRLRDRLTYGKDLDPRPHGGVAFPGCPVWWLRSRATFPDAAPEGVGYQPVAAYVVEQRTFMQWGAGVRAAELPAALHRLMQFLEGQEAVRDRNAVFKAQQESKRDAAAGRMGAR